MPLTMRPTGLGHGVYKDDIDFGVFSGEWCIGRIYEQKGFAPEVRFFWSLHGVVLTRSPRLDRIAPSIRSNRYPHCP
jgi:hypothetical protein